MLRIEIEFARKYMAMALAKDPAAAQPLSQAESRELEELEQKYGRGPVVNPVRSAARRYIAELRRSR